MGLVHSYPLADQVSLVEREIKGVQETEEGKSLVEVGLFNTGQLFMFQCPICMKIETNDQRMELACTGPGSTDDHPLEPMMFIGIKPKESSISVPAGQILKQL